MGQRGGLDVQQVRTAHADAWDAHGRHRESSGGGATRLPGVRLMASGLPHPQWNNGDVTDPGLVDVEAVRAWYADRDTPWGRGVPWGLRVPAGMPWEHGRLLFTKRLMGLLPERFTPTEPPDGTTMRVAGTADADAVLAVDCVAFETPDEVERPWVEPLLSQPDTTVCLVEMDGRPVGAGHCLVTDGDAGPAVYVAGIGVIPEARRRGIASAMSSWLIQRGFAAGAELAHLHPDTDEAAAVYVRLGFEELPGLDIYVDVA